LFTGNEDLKEETEARVVAPKADSHRIPGIDEGLSEEDVWKFGDLEMSCIETPGHTSHSLCFWFPTEGALFTGPIR
jgi:hydroxyacylglutathione hydrolase